MTFLPIVERQLRESSRRPATYRMRSLLALAALAIWFFLLVAGSNTGIRKGMMLFIALGVLALGFCLVAGIFLTSDCLSEEKREGTIGLLFLTELKGYDVVFGKLVATSLHSIYGLLAVLPLLALPLLMGGVTSGEFWRVTAVLLLTLFLTLSVGMLVSALVRETRQAMSATLFIIVILCGIFPLFWWIQKLFSPAMWDFLLWPSPGYLYTRAFDYFWRFPTNAAEFWKSAFTILIVSTAALFTACIYLPRAWHEKAEITDRRHRSGWRHRVRFGSVAGRLAERGRLNQNPFYWLCGRDQLPAFTAKLIVGLLSLIWIGCYAGCYSSSGRTKEICFGISVFFGYGIHQVLKALIAIEASRRLSEDRQSGALELLLVTPLRISKIPSGQRRALWVTYRWPMFFTGLINLGLFLLIAGKNPLGMQGDDRIIFSEMFIGGAVMLPLDAFALSWVGMSMAMKKRGHNRAIYATLARVMLPPWLAVLLFIFLGVGGAHMNSSDIMGFVGFWLFGSLMLDIFQASAAGRGVLAELRRDRSGYETSTFHRTINITNPNSTDENGFRNSSPSSAGPLKTQEESSDKTAAPTALSHRFPIQ